MKTKLISIVWNDKQPIYSIDCNRFGVIATAGADNSVNVFLFLFLKDLFRALLNLYHTFSKRVTS